MYNRGLIDNTSPNDQSGFHYLLRMRGGGWDLCSCSHNTCINTTKNPSGVEEKDIQIGCNLKRVRFVHNHSVRL